MDLIDREAAIEVIKSADNMFNSKQLALYAAMDNIRLLPSMRYDELNISPCDVCMYGGDMYEPECLRCPAK